MLYFIQNKSSLYNNGYQGGKLPLVDPFSYVLSNFHVDVKSPKTDKDGKSKESTKKVLGWMRWEKISSSYWWGLARSKYISIPTLTYIKPLSR